MWITPNQDRHKNSHSDRCLWVEVVTVAMGAATDEDVLMSSILVVSNVQHRNSNLDLIGRESQLTIEHHIPIL